MVILMSKQPSYVRCIKPNDDKRPGKCMTYYITTSNDYYYIALLDEKIIFHQVKYLGLMENLRVRRAGFCYRRPFAVFLNRYKSLCPKTWPTWKGVCSEWYCLHNLILKLLCITWSGYRYWQGWYQAAVHPSWLYFWSVQDWQVCSSVYLCTLHTEHILQD